MRKHDGNAVHLMDSVVSNINGIKLSMIDYPKKIRCLINCFSRASWTTQKGSNVSNVDNCGTLCGMLDFLTESCD